MAGLIFKHRKTLPRAASVLSRALVFSQNEPQTAPRPSSAWVGRQRRWPPGIWGIQRYQLSIKILKKNLASNHCQHQQMKKPIIQSLVWQRDRDAREWKSNIEGGFENFLTSVYWSSYYLRKNKCLCFIFLYFDLIISGAWQEFSACWVFFILQSHISQLSCQKLWRRVINQNDGEARIIISYSC